MKKIIIMVSALFCFTIASNIQLMHASSVGEVSVSMNNKILLKNVNYLDNTGLFDVEAGRTISVTPTNSDYTVEFSLDNLYGDNHIITAIGPSYNSNNYEGRDPIRTLTIVRPVHAFLR